MILEASTYFHGTSQTVGVCELKGIVGSKVLGVVKKAPQETGVFVIEARPTENFSFSIHLLILETQSECSVGLDLELLGGHCSALRVATF